MVEVVDEVAFDFVQRQIDEAFEQNRRHDEAADREDEHAVVREPSRVVDRCQPTVGMDALRIEDDDEHGDQHGQPREVEQRPHEDAQRHPQSSAAVLGWNDIGKRRFHLQQRYE